MKFIPLPVLQVARTFGLIRGLRTVRVPAGSRMHWAVAVQILGCWRVLRQPKTDGPFGLALDGRHSNCPLVFTRLADARTFLDKLGL